MNQNGIEVSEAGIGATASCYAERPRSLDASIGTRGEFTIECFSPDGELKWAERVKNGTCSAALDSILNVYFRSVTQITAWYCGLIDNAAYTALAAADTMASHAGWAESVAYSESVRQTWSPAAASSQTITNGTAMSFTMTGTGTLRGAFITSASDKSGATGTLFATAAFTGGNMTWAAADVIKVTYAASASAL